MGGPAICRGSVGPQVVVGLIWEEGLKMVDLRPEAHATKIIAEVTLVWVLFAVSVPRRAATS
jgi:hypothetical protein